jgi:tetratricopeptide (TPR) repeat protein
MAGARAIAQDALDRGLGNAGALHAFLGMIHARASEPDQAIDHLAAAHRAMPGDVTVACNLAALQLDAGRDADALATASAALAQADASLRVARLRAFLAQKLERFAEAAQAYELIVSRAPDDFESWNNLGNARAGMGDPAGAVEALKRAVALDPAAAPARLNLAAALVSNDQSGEAEALLRAMTHDLPQDSRPPYQLYVLLKEAQRQEEALEVLELAVARDPDAPAMQLKLAVEYGILRRTQEAEAHFRRTIALDPGETDAYLGLAIQFEHMNREDELAPLLALARANGLADGPCRFIEAYDLRRQGQFARALALLDLIPPEIEPIRVVHLRATLLDRLGRSDEAFAAFAQANALMADNPTDPLERAAQLRAELRGQIALLTPQWRDSWADVAPAADGHADPVFLVGFPRSGTTLLDTILMGHPDTVVLEEQPPLNLVEDALGGMAAIPGLDAAAIARARAHYFAEVAKLQPLAPGKTLVDKSPLFMYRLPLIHRLFPRAKIILALRHPCDVVLSCFMSNFRLNSAMSNFLRLEDAAALYDLCFTHFETARALLPVDCHEVVYERLVEDVEAELRPLMDWLGLGWRDEMADHQKTAKARGLITTASYSQVAEPIYKRAAGRWKRYEHWLAPQMDVLMPWARKLGY